MERNEEELPFDPNAFLSKISGGRTVLHCRAGQVVYRQGDPADSVFFIQTGKAKVIVTSEQGKDAVIAVLGPDNFFGEKCLIGQALRLATVAALTECEIMRIPKEEIVTVIHEEPAFAELFIAHLLSRNSRVEEDLVDQLFNSSERRLARTLLLLANFGKEGKPEPILANINQETLAEIIGTTRSRVSFFMNKFRELGLISYNGNIEVHRSLLNVVLHEKPESELRTAAKSPLRDFAVHISMGDFDTSYSSLSFLRGFLFDKIKIDQPFVRDLATRDDCVAVVRAVTSRGQATSPKKLPIPRNPTTAFFALLGSYNDLGFACLNEKTESAGSPCR